MRDEVGERCAGLFLRCAWLCRWLDFGALRAVGDVLGVRRLFRQGDSGTRTACGDWDGLSVAGAVPEGFLRPPGGRDASGGSQRLEERYDEVICRGGEKAKPQAVVAWGLEAGAGLWWSPEQYTYTSHKPPGWPSPFLNRPNRTQMATQFSPSSPSESLRPQKASRSAAGRRNPFGTAPLTPKSSQSPRAVRVPESCC